MAYCKLDRSDASNTIFKTIEGSGKITQPKVVDPCFPEKQQHDWRYVYVCISYWKLYACIRIILHSLKYHITKASNRAMT